MTLSKGSTFFVAFVIDDRPVVVQAIFTGRYVTLNGEQTYQLENPNNQNNYYFTEAQLKECAPLNDSSLMGEDAELTLG
jgi:hypothetical protein